MDHEFNICPRGLKCAIFLCRLKSQYILQRSSNGRLTTYRFYFRNSVANSISFSNKRFTDHHPEFSLWSTNRKSINKMCQLCPDSTFGILLQIQYLFNKRFMEHHLEFSLWSTNRESTNKMHNAHFWDLIDWKQKRHSSIYSL